MKQLRFESKDESNSRRDREALQRSPEERMHFFFQLIRDSSKIYTTKKENDSNNFTLEKSL
jgi:hypothetical protein